MTTRTIVAATLVALLTFGASAGDAQSCRDGKTAFGIDGGTEEVDFPGDVPSGSYAAASDELWDDILSDALTITGSSAACWAYGIFDGPFEPEVDEDTYYECHSDHGWPGPPAPCLAYHTTAAIAPENSAGTTIEYVRAGNYGDGVSIADSSGPVTILDSYFGRLLDDGVETDWLKHNVTVKNSLFEGVFMAFAFDARTSAASRTPPVGYEHYYYNNIIDLMPVTHAHSERTGHGGVFKPDQGGKDPAMRWVGNKVLMGPEAGAGQLMFPFPEDTIECENNVYFWDGTNDAFDDMMAEDDNQANFDGLEFDWGAEECIIIIKREDVCDCEVDADGGSAEFRAMSFAAIDNHSWNYIITAWKAGHFPSGPPGGGGCGIGPELLAILPLLGAAWRRRAPAPRR